MNILRLTPGAAQSGLIYFRLGLWVGTKEVAHWAINSGARGAQILRTYLDPLSRPGNQEPIPEAVYPVGAIQFAGARDDYDTYFSGALGPVWVALPAPKEGQLGYRGEIGLHLDANRYDFPGTAGCVGVIDTEDLEEIVAALRQYDPKQLVVDYGLGTVPGAPGKVPDTLPVVPVRPSTPQGVTVYINDEPMAANAPIVDGRTVVTLDLLAKMHGYKLTWEAKTKTARLSK